MTLLWYYWIPLGNSKQHSVQTHQNLTSLLVILFTLHVCSSSDWSFSEEMVTYSVNYTKLCNSGIVDSEMKECGAYHYWKWNKQLFNEGLFCSTCFWILKVNGKIGLMVLFISHFPVVCVCSEDNELPRDWWDCKAW